MKQKKAGMRNLRNRFREVSAPLDLRRRLILVASVLGFFSVVLLCRAAYIQLVDSEFYQHQGESRFMRDIPIVSSRGMIMDRNGEPVAVSTPVESIWGNPQELIKSPEYLPALAKVLGVEVGDLQTRLRERADKEFIYLKRRINPDEARRILSLKTPSVFSEREYRRFYPQGEAMAHILGFTNIDDHGQEGLELSFDQWLSGKNGSKRVFRDRQGRSIDVDRVQAPQPGGELTLSIDRRVQYLAYRELQQTLLKSQATSGSIVILDVNNGEIVAMVNLPTYNPNAIRAGADTRRNRAVTDLLEPGSTMKPITVAAALTSGQVTPNTLVDTAPGYLPIGRFTIRDGRNYGTLSVTGIITKSSNVGSAKLAAMLPNDYFYEFIKSFGFGQRAGSGFPGESGGLLPNYKRWSGSSKTTISYGYGLSVTPLQIAQAYAALGNGGMLISPTFVKGQINEGVPVLDPGIARKVVDMMETVTQPGGTATQAAIPGYLVAGKTGTSRQASAGGYSRRYTTVFAGLVPASKPRFASVVVVNDPQVGSYYAGLVAAPVFRRVMEGTLRLMDVPPDDIKTWLAGKNGGDVRFPIAPDEEENELLTIPDPMATQPLPETRR